jgi:hypothetical protein
MAKGRAHHRAQWPAHGEPGDTPEDLAPKTHQQCLTRRTALAKRRTEVNTSKNNGQTFFGSFFSKKNKKESAFLKKRSKQLLSVFRAAKPPLRLGLADFMGRR